MERFNLAAEIRAVHVPAGPVDAISEVIAYTIAGRTAYLMAPISLALPQICSGKLIALGVRSHLEQDPPNLIEHRFKALTLFE